MPVRSLNSVIKKPVPRDNVLDQFQHWARDLLQSNSNIQNIGYYGSYRRGDYTPGSDLDIIIIVKQHPDPIYRRGTDFIPENFPVPCDIQVFTRDEIDQIKETKSGFQRILKEEVKWFDPHV